MVEQAVESITAAYEDGITRQCARLRLDMFLPTQEPLSNDWQWDGTNGWRRMPAPPEMYRGVRAVHNYALPRVRELVSELGRGVAQQELRVTLIGEEDSPDIGTLLYRDAEDPKDDVAVFFLAGRPFAGKDGTIDFLEGMKRRLVVMLNSEDAASTFKVENEASDFWSEPWSYLAAKEFCSMFPAQTYHYSTGSCDGWPNVLFRAYPHPWAFYIEGLDDRLVLLKETEAKPNIEQIEEWTAEFEQSSGASAMQKREKTIRDRRD
ncbi:unnamed protein product [Prorocentrum cordatum]|nr:unnamed protein product [Polarella glacialis]